MAENRKKFSREPPDQRRNDLIAATLSVITRSGMQAATVRAISEEANVTQGLIRHHFKTKEDLISAAYEAHLSSMTEMARAAVKTEKRSAIARLATFITTSLVSPVAGPDSLGVWAGFLPLIRHDKAIFGVHRRTNQEFRDHLRTLIEQALIENGATPSTKELEQQSIVCGCIIDGLWLESGLFPDSTDTGELTFLALQTVSRTLGLPQLATLHSSKA